MLFVHLQRIVFSFETFTNEKLNSKFDFPTTLDLRPYSYKGVAESEQFAESTDEELKRLRELEDESFIYKLVGVTIHVGAADHGHYYAIINSARGDQEVDPVEKPAEWNAAEADKWFKFDDEDVMKPEK